MIALDDLQGAIWRDDEMTAAECAAVVADPWWRTVPREYRLAWWARRTHQRWAHQAGWPSWDAFLAEQGLTRLRTETPGFFDRPPAEHSTRDPWPDGFAVPAAVAKLQGAADAGWEVRVGYARASKKLGRGNVGTGADARWVLHHFVRLDARPVGTRVGSCVTVTYCAQVAEKLSWKFESGAVPGDSTANVTKVRAALAAAPSQELLGRIASLATVRALRANYR